MKLEYLPVMAATAAVLAGCAGNAPPPERITIREPVTVTVPVPVPCEIEPGLLTPIAVALPEFIPASPPASSALTPEGERRLQTLLVALRQRIRAWQAWAEECGAQARN